MWTWKLVAAAGGARALPSVFAVLTLKRGAERRKALVRNAAPTAALRLGQSLQRKGLPVHDADRRALRRSTTVFARPWPH